MGLVPTTRRYYVSAVIIPITNRFYPANARRFFNHHHVEGIRNLDTKKSPLGPGKGMRLIDELATLVSLLSQLSAYKKFYPQLLLLGRAFFCGQYAAKEFSVGSIVIGIR